VTDRIQVAAIAGSVILLGLVIELTRRRRLSDDYALTWIACAIGLLAISVFRGALDRIALWLGIFYPPAVLLLALIVLVFVAALNFSIVVSRQRRQIERLIQEVAILEAELRSLRSDRPDTPGDQRGA
jgi:hypothetical protein